jgi:predicted RecB family nuclease
VVDHQRPFLDAYATQRCDVRLQHSFDTTLGELEHRSFSEAERRRIVAGRGHEAHVLDTMAQALGGRIVVIDAADRSASQDATVAALDNGVDVIAQAWLPADEEGRRIGRPDLLIKTSDGYLPVEIKLHLLSTEGTGSLESSTLDMPFPDHSFHVANRKFRKGSIWFNDALQLAHYTRMLETLGHAARDDGLLGGVIDGSGTLWWIDLDHTSGRTNQTPLDAYDSIFAERLALVDATLRRNLDPSQPRPREPWWHKECEGCPYSEICHEELASRDDVSLVRWSNPASLELLRKAGVTARVSLATLDTKIVDLGARLSETTMPLPLVVERANDAERHDLLADVVGRRMGVRRHLVSAGLVTVEDLLSKDERSLALAGQIRDLPRLVRRARAGVAGGVVRSVSADDLDARRADVEVDIDMESYEHATYLWGALITNNVPLEDIEETYVPFVTFDPLDDEEEARIFAELWSWLSELRRRVTATGHTFRAYCFWHPAEEGQMRRAVARGGAELPSERELKGFFASDAWVDLHHLCKEQLITEGPLGLKVMAKLAGFEWRDEDPSGEASIGWYEEAMFLDSEPARQRLLRYNEDDVRATKALREWLDGPARDLPHVDDVAAP